MKVPCWLRFWPMCRHGVRPWGRRGFDRRFQGYAFVELDRDFLRDTLLPDLVERHFAGLDGVGLPSLGDRRRRAPLSFGSRLIA